jgi:hypothetical protein
MVAKSAGQARHGAVAPNRQTAIHNGLAEEAGNT